MRRGVSSSGSSTAPGAKTPGLRERKAAQTRLAIAEALRLRLHETDLNDISADELAESANISRVTFFNYFGTKTEAVAFLMSLSVYDVQVSIHRDGLRGAAAVDRVFAMMGDFVAESPAFVRRVYAAFCSARATSFLTPTRAEQLMLAPDVDPDAVALVSLGHLFVRLADEAREDGLELLGSSYEISAHLGALFNGTCMIGGSSPETDFKQIYRRSARRALGLLGAEGMRDPRPPRIPERYRTKPSRSAKSRKRKGRNK